MDSGMFGVVRSRGTDAMQRALTAHKNGRPEEARRHYEQVLQESPDDADALHLYGVLMHQLGETDAAIVLIRRSLQIAGANPQACLNLGHILLGKKRAREALDYFRQAARLVPMLADAWFNVGNCLLRLGDSQAAVASFDRALALRPDQVRWLYERAIARRESGDAAGADRDYRAGLDGSPERTKLYSRMGMPTAPVGR